MSEHSDSEVAPRIIVQKLRAACCVYNSVDDLVDLSTRTEAVRLVLLFEQNAIETFRGDSIADDVHSSGRRTSPSIQNSWRRIRWSLERLIEGMWQLSAFLISWPSATTLLCVCAHVI